MFATFTLILKNMLLVDNKTGDVLQGGATPPEQTPPLPGCAVAILEICAGNEEAGLAVAVTV